MFEQIKGKRVLITGASSGIGEATAKLFFEHGARVGLHYKNNPPLYYGQEDTIIKGDLLDKKVRDELVPTFVKYFGGIDILVNNAGACYEYKHFSELSEESWDKMFDLHSKAPFILSRNAFEHMKNQNWGRIINISTASMEYAGANNMHYFASKAALDALTKGFANEGVKHNILVNSIRCGVIDTPMRKRVSGYSETRFEKRVSMIPVGHAGKPIDIARMILYLASAGGNFITGQIYKISGGE